jgi:Tol biopolymer transport system component/DNA-binding winged helix-turn-helix (wHTH) protein
VEQGVHSPRLVRFESFEVDVRAGELREAGVRLKLPGQPFQVLAILLEYPGEVVTREELQKRLWPDTFVDVDHNLNTAINKIREVLGDSAENPRFVETLPRRGYRFVAPVEGAQTTDLGGGSGGRQGSRMPWVRPTSILFVVLVLLAAAVFLFIYRRLRVPASPAQRALTRLTFDDGLQFGATWSPDGRFIAYSSNRGGKFDIWVQQVSGGDPVQITKGLGHNWQPEWSPDGKYIAYRSEEGDGGLFVVPALGGFGLERRIASFGYHPRWSPDSKQILFNTSRYGENRAYIVNLDGSQPREILAEFMAHHEDSFATFAWYPDGKSVSVCFHDDPGVWMAQLAGGAVVKLANSPEVTAQLSDVALGGTRESWQEPSVSSSWAHSGRAIYFSRAFRGAVNVWRMSVDPETMRPTALERLTTGQGPDGEPAVSPDGRRLAFTSKTQHVQTWIFPFDATNGRVTGTGRAMTSPGLLAWRASLSSDGTKLAFCPMRAGKWELWEKSLIDGREAPVISDDHVRDLPQWSPNGMRLAYTRSNFLDQGETQVMVWSAENRREEPLMAPNTRGSSVWDWSPLGQLLLVGQNSDQKRSEIWVVPLAAAPRAETAARKIASDPAYDLFQSRFSPDGRWVVFEGVRNTPTRLESALYVMSAAGGPWMPISHGKHWDDKPRWSPDGRTIYFVSDRGGFFNVWAIRFDSAKGKPVGEPFRVTSFESPELMVSDAIPKVDFSLTQNRFVLTMEQSSGSIWLLDNVSP